MANARKVEPSEKRSTAIKARLAVEAALVQRGVSVLVRGLTLTLRADESQQSRLHFGETDAGQLHLSLALISEHVTAEELEEALLRTAPPDGTELQIVDASGSETPIAICKRPWTEELDPLKVFQWCAQCETAFWGEFAASNFAKVPLEVEEPKSSPEFAAAAVTRKALLDELLERFGEAVRVTASDGTEGVVVYGLPHADTYLQFTILPGAEKTPCLSACVYIGCLFKHYSAGIKWVLRNCGNKLLTMRPASKHSRRQTIEVGFYGQVSVGASDALTENLERIVMDAETIRVGLSLWFPNLVDGGMFGAALLDSDQPELQMPLRAVSDPALFVKQWEEFIADHADIDRHVALPYQAAFWSESYAIAVEWADQLEARARATDPANDEEKEAKNASLSFSHQMRHTALKALGRYEEALENMEKWIATGTAKVDRNLQLARAILCVRLRRLEEASEILKEIGEHPGPAIILTHAFVLAGTGRTAEAKAVLRDYESQIGVDIAARRLFKKLKSEYRKKGKSSPKAIAESAPERPPESKNRSEP